MSTLDLRAKEEAAALWFAKRRRGVMALEERAAFDAWRHDSGNAALFAELEQVWNLLDEARTDSRPAPVPLPVRQKVARSALLAVMCAVSIGIGVISYSGNHEFWTTLDWVER